MHDSRRSRKEEEVIADHPYYRKLEEAFTRERGRTPNDLDKLSLQQEFKVRLLVGIQEQLDRIESRLKTQ